MEYEVSRSLRWDSTKMLMCVTTGCWNSGIETVGCNGVHEISLCRSKNLQQRQWWLDRGWGQIVVSVSRWLIFDEGNLEKVRVLWQSWCRDLSKQRDGGQMCLASSLVCLDVAHDDICWHHMDWIWPHGVTAGQYGVSLHINVSIYTIAPICSPWVHYCEVLYIRIGMNTECHISRCTARSLVCSSVEWELYLSALLHDIWILHTLIHMM